MFTSKLSPNLVQNGPDPGHAWAGLALEHPQLFCALDNEILIRADCIEMISLDSITISNACPKKKKDFYFYFSIHSYLVLMPGLWSECINGLYRLGPVHFPNKRTQDVRRVHVRPEPQLKLLKRDLGLYPGESGPNPAC